jgi:hypothetical protein
MKTSTPINVNHLKKKALFGIFSGLIGMLSLMQSTQVPKSINYYLSTFIFFMKIYFNLQCHNKSIFNSQNSTLRQNQYAETNNKFASKLGYR